MSHNSTNVLRGGLLGLNVIKRVRLIGKQAKGHARRDLKIMGEGINPAFYARIVIGYVAVEVTEFRGRSLKSRALEGCGNVCFDKSSTLESHETLKMLHKEDDVPMIHVFSY